MSARDLARLLPVLVVAAGLRPGAVLADERLDPRVVPTFQSIELDLDARESDYSGSVRIELQVNSPTSTFSFHAEEMSLDRVTLSGQDGEIPVETELGERGLRKVTTGRELTPGAYVLEIDFSKDYNTRAVGLYRAVHDGTGYLFSQFQAVDARKAFPCWDEPNYKIEWQTTITHPIQQEAVTNMPVAKERIGAETKTKVFERTPPMPSYLLAIAAGPLESIAIPGLSVKGRIYTVKGQKDLGKLAAEITPGILEALEDWFGRPYPYRKLDFIAIPEYWPGAMENPGAVTYADNILLVDYDEATVAQKRVLARVTAHELAHMWFGDLVTMEWWDDLWLNESFADWLGDKITEQLYPEYDLAVSELGSIQSSMQSDSRPSSSAIRKPVDSPADIMEDLGLAYNKGKQVLGMVEAWIGPDVFQEGVRNYINRYAWKNTEAQDLFAALSAAAERDLAPMLSSFLDQPGLPLVSVDVGAGGLLEVSQQRFLSANAEAEAQSWVVPVHVKYSDGKEVYHRTVLLDKERTQIEAGVNIQWAMPDAGARGYYRWSAPKDMLFALASNPEDNLTKRERAAFLSNAKALLSGGEIDGGEYLGLLTEMSTYTGPEVMQAVMSDLGSVEVAFVTDDLADEFAFYVRQTLRPALDRYGLEARDGEAETVSIMRPRLLLWLGERGEDEQVKTHCEALADEYLADPKSIDAALASTSLRVSALDGDQADFDRYREAFEAAGSPSDRTRLLGALGSFRDPKLQDQALEYVFSGKVRPTEIFRVVSGVGRTDEGREKIFQWLMNNYDRITGMIPPEFAAYMPFFVSGCSEERLAAARAFFAEPDHSVEGTDRNLKKVADQVMECVDVREREGGAVAEYLTQLAARR